MMNSTQAQHPLFGPFAMLLDPERVIREMGDCERLNRFQRCIYRPLDKPLIAKTANTAKIIIADAAAEFDRLVDEADEIEFNA